MRKNAKRWIAFLLAVIMVATTCMYQSDSFLWATGDDQTVEDTVTGPDEKTQVVVLPGNPEEAVSTDPSGEQIGSEKAAANPTAPLVGSETPPADPATEAESAEETASTEDPLTEAESVEETASTEDPATEAESTEEIASTEESEIAEPAEETESTEETVSTEEPEEDSEELTEDESATYTVNLNHVLLTEIGLFSTSQEITLTSADFVDGSADLMKYAVSREGMIVTSNAAVVRTEDFDSANYAYVEINYGVAEGWTVVRKDTTALYAGAFRARAIYVGTIDDVEFVPVGQIPVSISFYYANGSLAKATETVMAEQEADGGAYILKYAFENIAGYVPEVDSDTLQDGCTLVSFDTAEDNNSTSMELHIPADVQKAGIGILFVATEGTYTVVTRVPNAGYKNVDLTNAESYTETRSEAQADKAVGELTTVVAEQKTGFSAMPVMQQVVNADGSTEVVVEYVRNTYTVTYDSQGGSYVPAKKGDYEETVQVYTGEAGEDGSPEIKKQTCGKEEHQHSRGWGGCYVLGSLICGKEEHTHSNGCYEITPAVPERPATFAPAPTRQGYTFTGWYQDSACTIPADQEIVLGSDVTVYAGWKADTANYTIAYFKEVWDNSTGSSYYAYVSSETKQAEVGSQVTGGNNARGIGNYHEYANSTTETVKADGSTVVQVKYNLKRYTFIFDLQDERNAKGTITMNGKEYHGSEYRIENVVLGQDISELWPTTDNTSRSDGKNLNTWGGTYQTKRFEVTTDLLPNSGKTKTFEADWTTSGPNRKVEYWLQKPDGSGYEVDTRYSQSVISTNLGAKEIYGFKKIDTPRGYEDSDKKTYRFYYDRNTLNLTYKNVDGSNIDTKKVKFGASINNDTYKFTPSRPTGVDADYTFVGWYDNNQGAGEPYQFTTMPDGGLVLYAIWKAPEKTVTVYKNNGEAVETIIVSKNSVAEVATPEKEGFVFEGWYTDPNCTSEFDLNAPITQDVSIYAKWVEKTETRYTVRHIVIDKDGREVDIIPAKTVDAMVGMNVSEYAARLTGEYSEYVPNATVQNILLQSAESLNVITFIYSPLAELKYSVQYQYEGSTVQSESEKQAPARSFKVYPNETILKELTMEGYEIVGDKFKMANLTSDNSSNIIIFELQRSTYRISYKGIDDETGEPVDIAGLQNPSEYQAVTPDFTLNNPSVTGYVFRGWTTNATVDGKPVDEKSMDITVAAGSVGHLEFVAHFEKFYEVEVTANSATYPYDGTLKQVSGFEGKAENDPGIPVIKNGKTYYVVGLTAGAEGTDAGTYDSEVKGTATVQDASGKDVSYRFHVTTKDGLLTIEKAKREALNVTGYNNPYDGGSHTIKVDGLLKGDKVEYSYDGGTTWKTELREYKDVTSEEGVKILVRATNQNYEPTEVKGEGIVKITRATVTVTALGGSKIYGEPDPEEFTAEVAGLCSNDTVEYTVAREPGENVGKYDVEATGALIQNNYQVVYVPGTFVINPSDTDREGTIEITDYKGEYDAKQHTIEVIGTVDGDQLSYSYDGGTTWMDKLETYKNVTESTVQIMVKVTNPNYKQDVVKTGSVTITPKAVTVTADNKVKKYGETDPDLTATAEGMLKDENGELDKITYSSLVRVQGETVGTYAITITGDGRQGNYEVTFVPGTFTIEKADRPTDQERALSVTDYNGVYDAEEHTITVNHLDKNDTVEYRYDGKGEWTSDLKTFKAAETYTVEVRVTNPNYNVKEETLTGTVTITPFEMVVKAINSGKTYGEKDPELEAVATEKYQGQTKPDDGVEITWEKPVTRADGEDVGTYEITPVVTEEQGNYKVTTEKGTFTITAAEREKALSVTPYEGVYDGNPHTITVNNLLPGDTVLYSTDNGVTWKEKNPEYTDVSNTPVWVKVTNPNYTPKETVLQDEKTCYVEITHRPVTVTAVSDSKVYGAKDPKFTATEADVLEKDKETLVYTVTRVAGEDVGHYTMTVSGDEVQGNYAVTYAPGEFVITPADRETPVTVEHYKGTYDANEHSIKVTGVLADDKVEYSTDGTTWSEDLPMFKNVTETPVTVYVKITNANYENVPKLMGTVMITPKAVTVMADNKVKKYGETDPDLTATAEGMLKDENGELDKITYSSLVRVQGETVGTYAITVTGDGRQGNYEVTFVPGTFTIEKADRPTDQERALSVTDYNGVYDAEEHTITVNHLDGNDTVKYRYDNQGDWTSELKKFTDVGTHTVEVQVTNPNYTEETVELTGAKAGTVTITPFEMVVTANDKTKGYGEDDPEWDAVVTAANPGQTKPDDRFDITYSLTREAGENVGSYDITPHADEVQGNYAVTTENGTLTITAVVRENALSVTPYEGVYDGGEHTITVNNLLPDNGDVVLYSTDNGATWTAEKPVYENVTNTAVKVKVTNPNYTPDETVLESSIKITHRPVTVTAVSDSKVYGAQDPEFTATETGVLEKDKGTLEYTITRAGGENVGTYVMTVSGESVQGNYAVTYETGTFTITPADRETEVKVEKYEGTYDAGEHSIRVTGALADDKVEYSTDGTNWSEDLPMFKNVTETPVTVYVKITNANYENVPELTGTVTINPKAVTVTAEDNSKVYGTDDPEFTAKAVGMLENESGKLDTITYKEITRDPGETVGEYTINVTGEERQGNYTVSFVAGTFTITDENVDVNKVVTKTHEEREYALGEEIVFTIEVTNIYSEAKTITIEEQDGVTITGESVFENVAPGAKVGTTAVYRVSEEDILSGSFMNQVTARFSGVDDPYENTDTVEDLEDVIADYTVTKTITNPQPQYNVGDTIQYAITVASQANVTLSNITVTDQLTDATGTVTFTEVNGATVNADNTVTIAALAPGASVTLNCEYTITRDDAGRNIINTASATADPVVPTDPENPDPIDPGEEESDPTDPAVVENLYNLTIHYVYAVGGTAAPDVTAQFLAGETFSYDSPAIDGYTPDYAFLRSSAEGMPARDVELTVVYTAVPGPAVYVPGTPVIPGVPPTPVPVADAPAAVAALPVPAGTAVPLIPVITIPDNPVPLAGGEIAEDDEEDDVVIVPVDDPEVPLAGPGDMHHCCILHFLLMLAAVIVYMFYSDDMRRKQKKIAGLADEYGQETLKRR